MTHMAHRDKNDQFRPRGNQNYRDGDRFPRDARADEYHSRHYDDYGSHRFDADRDWSGDTGNQRGAAHHDIHDDNERSYWRNRDRFAEGFAGNRGPRGNRPSDRPSERQNRVTSDTPYDTAAHGRDPNAPRFSSRRPFGGHFEPHVDNAPYFTGAHGNQVYERESPLNREMSHSPEHVFDNDYQQWRNSELDRHDRDYNDWRSQQARAYDTTYSEWRKTRQDKFAQEFSDWRATQRPLDNAAKGNQSPPMQTTSDNPKLDTSNARNSQDTATPANAGQTTGGKTK
jgi:hypothetical protein